MGKSKIEPSGSILFHARHLVRPRLLPVVSPVVFLLAPYSRLFTFSASFYRRTAHYTTLGVRTQYNAYFLNFRAMSFFAYAG